MKRLLFALASAVAVSTASAKIAQQYDFESSVGGFTTGELVAYDDDEPSCSLPYPFATAGSKYLVFEEAASNDLDGVTGNVYLDMNLKFTPCQNPTLDASAKIAVYQNAESNLVVVASDGNGGTATNVITGVSIVAGEWYRVTISPTTTGFKVAINGVDTGSVYPSLTGNNTIEGISLEGDGALDNFVARTTDPFFQNPAVTIGGEGYASLADALADDPTATPQLEADASLATPLAYGESISVKLNNHTLSGITSGSLIALESTSGDVTTYTANYFPRTATAGQNGTAANPYEIADADDLVALQDAVLADAANGTTFASKSYVQTGNIDMTNTSGFYGIGWFDSSTSFASVPSGVKSDGKTAIPFAGTYDGQGYTISNVTIVKHSYAGVFNNVSGTVKDLTVQDIGLSGTCSEWGCAIVGNASNGALLENLTAVTSTGFNWGDSANHNVAGIVVRPFGAATIRGCVNNANISSVSKRLGGIASFVGSKVEGTVFDSCTNNATLVSTDGTRGVGGILGCAEGGLESGPTAAATVIRNCVDFGSETAQGSGGHAGAIVGSNWNGAYTYTDEGGNTFKASTVDCGYVKNTVFGRAYALPVTIDAAAYLTTVKQADLAAGNTYTLLADVASGTVYTFDAAGTISFNTNGYNFAGTVAVDRSTLMPATSETVGAVVTFTAAAGVASVDDVAYATFAEAVAAVASAPEGKQFVTLLDDIADTFTLAEAGSLAVRRNSHNLTVVGADGLVMGTPAEDPSTGITTYTAVEGVAKVYGDDDAWKWFASFADAFTYARAQSYQPKMTFMVGSDFTPDISSNLTLWTLEFVATTEDPITINLTNGNAKLVSTRIKFPTTATLNAVSGNVNSMSGGTLNVPSGVVLELASYATDGSSWNIAGLSGSGTIKNDDKSMYFFLGNTQYNLPTRMRGSSWCGTLELSGSNISGSNTWEAEFNKFANANSKVRFNGLTTPLYASGNDSVAIELVGNGLTISGEYESARTYTVGGTITGSGALTLADNTGILLLSGDTSGFTGSVTASGTSAVIFNSTASSTGSGNRIYVGTGKSATVGSSATWTAANLVLLGELTVNGTLAVNDNCIWCDKGVGVLRYANKDTLPTSAKFAGSWNSKCIIACDPGNKRFVLNNFGNAKSTLEIAGDNGVFSALPSTDNTAGTAPSINPAVILTANWTVSDGWAEADKVTTFSKLSGSGNLTVNGSASGTAAIYYTITELNDYTGTLGGNRGNFTIGKVNVAEPPANGARVVKTNIGANGSINDNVPLYVNGSDSGSVLEYKADGANGAGLYVKASAPAPADWAADSSTVTGKSAAEAYPALSSSALATADAVELTDWAMAKSIAFSDVAADTTGTYTEAFLLNCAVAEVEDEEAAFKAGINITVAADGTVTVTAPSKTGGYNGTLQMWGATNLANPDWTEISETSSTYKFYKYELGL